MTPIQKLELARSKLRSSIVELSQLQNRSEDDNQRLQKLTAEYQESEQSLQSLLAVAQAEPQAVAADMDAGDRESRRLEKRASSLEEGWLGRMARSERLETGPIGEYRQEHGLPEGYFPLHLLSDPEMQMRADAVTPGVQPVTQMAPILRPVWLPSAPENLGFMATSVPMSERSFPIISASPTAAAVATDAAHEATAAAWTVVELTPLQTRSRILLRDMDLMTFPQAESALRAECSNALSELMSNEIINGDGADGRVTGLQSALTEPTAPTGAAASFADFQNTLVDGIDGRYATSAANIRLLVGTQTYRNSHLIFKSNESDISAMAWLSMHSGGFSLSDHISAPASRNQQYYGTKSRGLLGACALPIWNSARLVRDEYSDAARGRVSLTVSSYWNFRVLRSANFIRGAIRLPA